MDELARPAIEALRERRVRYHPESQHRFAIESLEQAPDWCVSRQLWWGHQIPIWTCPDGHLTCAWPPPEACAECGSGALEREPDVLDTWFRSALWPFATLGWPEETPELERYYPGDVSVTAREIIRLWENRMIFAGLHLLGEVPFTDVIITSTVLAADGRRMSKSLGTGIDPMQPIEAHGADATRYGLLKISSTQDVRYSSARSRRGASSRRSSGTSRGSSSRRRGRRARGAARDARGAVDPRPARRRARRGGGGLGAVRLRARRRASSTASRSTTSATGTPRRSRGASTTATRTRARPRSRPGAAARAPAPADAPRDGGDLDAAAGPRGAAHRLALAGARRRLRRGGAGARPRREAAQVFRRSGVQVEARERGRAAHLRGGRPARAPAGDGDLEAELERLRKEIARAEGMLANERFVANAPAEVVEAERGKLERYRRELELLGS